MYAQASLLSCLSPLSFEKNSQDTWKMISSNRFLGEHIAEKIKTALEGKKKHKHKWKYYHGMLGYESAVCEICGIDINETKEHIGLLK